MNTSTRAAQAYSFSCNACGKCCNSPPAMSFDELLHHQRRFIGCLTVRVLTSPPGAGSIDGIEISSELAVRWRALHESLCIPYGSAWLRVSTRAYDYPSIGRCPALADDNRCAIHDDCKPAVCSAVPFDAELPDGLQRVVLHRRRSEAAYLGADCIRASASALNSDADVVIDGDRIVDTAYRAAVERLRLQSQQDANDWSRDLALALMPALQPSSHAASLKHGYMTLSLVPLLALLAARSADARESGLAYARFQISLINEHIERALIRRRHEDRPITEELRRFAKQYRAFIEASATDRVSSTTLQAA